LTTALRASAPGFGGAVVLLEGPPGTTDLVDPWGPVGGLGLMQAVKQQFDPGRQLAPGRFVGGI
jgi:glycolate oxidase FAD binding subunit